MSRHISRKERWKRTAVEEYTSEFGVVTKDPTGTAWVALVKEGFGLRICGRDFTRARDAMVASEQAAVDMKKKGSPLPPIQFPAHIF